METMSSSLKENGICDEKVDLLLGSSISLVLDIFLRKRGVNQTSPHRSVGKQHTTKHQSSTPKDRKGAY